MERRARDRRRSVRRRAKLRSLIFTVMVVSIPHQLKHNQLTFSSVLLAPEARVSTSIDNVYAIPPSQAYDSLIHEAAALYRVSPTLIRSVMRSPPSIRWRSLGQARWD